MTKGFVRAIIKWGDEQMNQMTKASVQEAVGNLHLPRYHEIPDVGLYLDQVVKYIGQYLNMFGEISITASMISNYVKKGLVDNPVKKQYDRQRIAYLFFIVVAKNVISLDNLALLIAMQKRTYPAQRAYDYFCDELENILACVFEQKESLDIIGVDSGYEKGMLRSAIIAVAHKFYLECSFALMEDRDREEIPIPAGQ